MSKEKKITKPKRHRTTATSQELVFRRLESIVNNDDGLVDIKNLLDKDIKSNWYIQKPSPSRERFCFEIPGEGIQTRAFQNIISEKGLEDVNNELKEASDFSLIIEDFDGNPVPIPPNNEPENRVFTTAEHPFVKGLSAVDEHGRFYSVDDSTDGILHNSFKSHENDDIFIDMDTLPTTSKATSIFDRTTKNTIHTEFTQPESSTFLSNTFGDQHTKNNLTTRRTTIISKDKTLNSVAFSNTMDDQHTKNDLTRRTTMISKDKTLNSVDRIKNDNILKNIENVKENVLYTNIEFIKTPKKTQPKVQMNDTEMTDLLKNDSLFGDVGIPPSEDEYMSDTSCISNTSIRSQQVYVIEGDRSFYLKDFRGEDTDLNRLIYVCGQATIQAWNALIMKSDKIVKIGEGAFGEVYKAFYMNEEVALKIFPFKENLEGKYPIVNGGEMIPACSITTELVVTKELSELANNENNTTPNFIELKKTFVVRGKYPQQLIGAWEKYDKQKGSENSHPSEYSTSNRHFVIMTLGLGGTDLEHYKIRSEKKALSIFIQVALSLAAAEIELKFEHRDLHWGNILVREIKTKDRIEYVINGKKILLEHQGVFVNIIDFTLSRICKENTVVFCNLNDDPEIFEGEGDKQFDVYREMRQLLKNGFQNHCPKTNCLWLEYLAEKLLYGVKGINVPIGMKNLRKEELLKQLEVVKLFDSATDYIKSEEFKEISDRFLFY